MSKRIDEARLQGLMAERNRVLRLCAMIRRRATDKLDQKLFTTVADQRAAEAKLAVAVAVLSELVKHVQAGTNPAHREGNSL